MDTPAELQWFGDYGFLPVLTPSPYDEAYFRKYEGYAQTPLGQALNAVRLALVRKWLPAPSALVLDVGIGCGQFVESRQPSTYGYDVNPAGVAWLKARDFWRNPYEGGSRFESMTFWDSLEHIQFPRMLLTRCREMVFVSLPIFRDLDHVLGSKHYRPDEHHHYWTRHGFIQFMGGEGFLMVDWNEDETKLGREGIETFAFRRHRG